MQEHVKRHFHWSGAFKTFCCWFLLYFLSFSQSSQQRFVTQEQPHLQLSHAGEAACRRRGLCGRWPARRRSAEVRDHAVFRRVRTQVDYRRRRRYSAEFIGIDAPILCSFLLSFLFVSAASPLLCFLFPPFPSVPWLSVTFPSLFPSLPSNSPVSCPPSITTSMRFPSHPRGETN